VTVKGRIGRERALFASLSRERKEEKEEQSWPRYPVKRRRKKRRDLSWPRCPIKKREKRGAVLASSVCTTGGGEEGGVPREVYLRG